jgi:hypothetical protein
MLIFIVGNTKGSTVQILQTRNGFRWPGDT